MKKILLLFCNIVLISIVHAQIIRTIAGTGTEGYNGDNISATAAQISDSWGIKVDNIGTIFFNDGGNNRVRKIDLAGTITTVAGNGVNAYSGDGGPATAAELFGNEGLALNSIDGAANIYIADANNFRVRKVTTGIISTVAGDGSSSYGGDSGPATNASIGNYLFGVAVDGSGNLYTTELIPNRIRKIDAFGIITTYAGNGISGYSGDGGPAMAAEIKGPYDVFADAIGNIYIADAIGARIRKVDTAGIITTVAGNGTAGYITDGVPATATEIGFSEGVTVDKCGNIFISERTNNRIRVVNTMGIISTIAGNGTAGFSGEGGPATAAELQDPTGIALDEQGNVYIVDQVNYRIRKITYGTHPPAFVAGHTQHLTVCENDTASIDTLLTATDPDAGQQEAWKVTGPATHGTASALYATTSTGGTLLPTGLYYAPATGYTGNDTFTVQVSDCGTGTDVTTVYVNVPNCSLGIQAATTYGLLLYPNPTAGSFSITLPAANKVPAQVTITDIVGKTVAEINTTTNKKNEVTLHVADGVYFINATAGGKKYYSKLVVSK